MNEASRPRAELRTAEVGPWPMNSYAILCTQTGQSVLIDPGADPQKLQDLISGTTPIAILLTHTHPDHVGALEEMQQRLAVPLMAHPGPHFDGLELEADRWLNHGDTVPVGDLRLRVYHTPGHIGDQICFAVAGDVHVVVGDTIFEGGPGKTWSHEGFKTSVQSLRDIVLAWDDDTICYPGHGSAFRLGDIRNRVDAFLSKDHGEFFGDATWEM